MKLKKTIAISLVLGAIAFFVLQKGANIELDIDYQSLNTPIITSNPQLKIAYIETAFSETPQGLIYAGGSLRWKQRISHVAVYIEHPNGNILFDTGLGEQVDVQFEAVPSLIKPLLKFTKNDNASIVLKRNQLLASKIFLSHMHWDHASGIKDFPAATIMTTQQELDFALSKKAEPPGFIASQYDGKNINWETIYFNSGAYEIFKQSFDLYNDGSIVFVELPGHTYGSIGMFVNLSETERYFFTGDLTWSQQGFDIPAEKFLLSSLMVDLDREKTRQLIYKISQLIKHKPQIQTVPSHDIRQYKNFKLLE